MGVPSETFEGEKRVALTPEGVKALKEKGFDVVVQSGAGEGGGFVDPAYCEAGAEVVPNGEAVYASADMILKVNGPSAAEVAKLKEGALLLSFLYPLSNTDIVKGLQAKKASAFGMELVPRITRAQSMDALSSMGTIAGYKASLLAANALPRLFPMMMTAAGTIKAAKVFVIGAGVAGLQAIATCRKLGAIVEAFDVRPAVKEQVESLGGKFVNIEQKIVAEGEGGYAKELSEEQHKLELELIGQRLAKNDVCITTALIPGRPAPKLIMKDMLKNMAAGSVIVDLAAPTGGNCEATVPGQTVKVDGVTILGPTDLLSQTAGDASRMYSRNIIEFFKVLAPEGAINIDMEDEIIAGMLVTRDGEILHEPTKQKLEQGA